MLYEAVKRLSRHSLIYAIGPAVHKIAGFLLIPLVTGYVGTTGNYGVLGMANVIIVIASQLLGINLLAGMSRYYTRYEDGEERAALVTTTLGMLLASTGVALIGGLLLATPLSTVILRSPEHTLVLRLALVILFFQLNGQVGMRYLQLREMSGTYGALQVLKLVLEIVLKVVFMVGLGLEHIGALYSVLVGEVLITLGLLGVILARLRFSFRMDMARRILRYSAPLIASGLCMFVLHQADRWVILLLRPECELGLYELGYKFGSMVNALLMQSFGLIWFPYIFSIHDEGHVRHVMRKIFTYFLFLSTAATLACALFAREMVVLLADPKFHESWPAIPVILAGYVFWAMYQLFQTVFFVRERTALTTWMTGLAAVVNIGLNLFLVPRVGYIGAAWATLVAFVLLAGVAWGIGERLMSVRYEPRVLAPLGLGAALYAAAMVLPLGSGWTLAAAKIGLLLLFPVLLWLGGYLTAQERSKLRALYRLARRVYSRKIRKIEA